MKKLPTWFLTRINDYDKALRVSMSYFLKTKNKDLYEYYYSERENYIYNYFSKRLSDKEFSKLTIY